MDTWRIGAVALVALALGPMAHAQITFSDGTFNDADWSIPTLVFSGSAGAVQQITGGNPGAWRRLWIGSAPLMCFVVGIKDSATYDPSTQGPIVSISYSQDACIVLLTPPQGAPIGLAVVQGGTIYFGPLYNPTIQTGAWVSSSFTGLTAASFSSRVVVTQSGPTYPVYYSIGTGQTPDFSASGGPIRFGFIMPRPNNLDASMGIDNWSVTVVSSPACYANCDGSTTAPMLSLTDFECFLGKYRAGDGYANCDGSTLSPTLTPADFVCFLNKYRAGCP